MLYLGDQLTDNHLNSDALTLHTHTSNVTSNLTVVTLISGEFGDVLSVLQLTAPQSS